MTARHHAGVAVCDECGDSYNKRLGRKRRVRGVKLILCPGCAKETDLKEEADAAEFPRKPRLDDDCAGCGVPLKVVNRSWEGQRGFWGRVICANLCVDCEPKREAKADAIYVAVGRRQRRSRRRDG